MELKEISSHAEMLKKIKDQERAYVFLFKPDSEVCNCALQSIQNALVESENLVLYSADVSKVRDIHEKYKITSVPSLLEFEKGNFKKVIKGCNDSKYYKALFENLIYLGTSEGKIKPPKNVVVYSTPTCSWCHTLKSYLRKNNVRFRDVDVSKDEKMAQKMVQKSGQQGVPQTEINGRIIVGFDRTKINELLEIQENS